MVVEYANLSNGVVCAPEGAHLCRIQSTWCEQKQWESILWTLPIDLLMHAAHGATIIIHDQSERARHTRAQWQGLSWIRYALRAAWGEPEAHEYSRSGFDVTNYWRQQYAALSPRVINWLEYYQPHVTGTVRITPCLCSRIKVTNHQGLVDAL